VSINLPIQCIYSGSMLMLKSLVKRLVRISIVLLGMLQIFVVSLLRTLSSFQISSFESGPHNMHRPAILAFVMVFQMYICLFNGGW